MIITSPQNEKIKEIIKLYKPRERRKTGLIVVEGKKEIEMAIECKLEIMEVYYCPELAKENSQRQTNVSLFSAVEEKVIEVTEAVFKKISYRENPDGCLVLARRPDDLKLEDIMTPSNSPSKRGGEARPALIVVLEAVEKPGNLGAILRTADATQADAVIFNEEQIDIYNPNVIHASRGAIFSMRTVASTPAETVAWLKKNKIKSYAAALPAKKNYLEINYKKPSAIILGAEDKGLSKYWLDNANELIIIPMHGKIDSLNVSVSGAIIMYEVARQRIRDN
ncbi:MAG: RNA methyltransferase [Patescibacteria group bacterium]|nr:RNA methyltransferase [Patescibacteria group bacterium]MDD4611039.1 RNA methyltransferase [Patescibacteria group bacterium]